MFGIVHIMYMAACSTSQQIPHHIDDKAAISLRAVVLFANVTMH